MPTPVVDNDGVDGKPPDDLFQGLKLWISHQVPDRSKWVGLVTVSGKPQTPAATTLTTRPALRR